MAKALSETRLEIDGIDREIIKLLAKRMICVKEVAQYKKENNLPMVNKKREEEVISNGIGQFKALGFDSPEFIRNIFSDIFKEAKNIERKIIDDS